MYKKVTICEFHIARAPRFQVSQQTKINTDQHYLYQQQKLLTAKTVESFPKPSVSPLLPLRPKTCMPRFRQDSLLQKSTGTEISDMYSQECKVN